ncbi:hypothetical protein P692DRAFT_20835104 [Suillus brevipes Sb2]|nr:hypothetical protein P692DRAFT_20835104 [Suillus brevipes Sb2]
MIIVNPSSRGKVTFYGYLLRGMVVSARRWAFALTDLHDGLPTSAPPEEKYQALKEALQKDSPPRCWFRGLWHKPICLPAHWSVHKLLVSNAVSEDPRA